MVDSPIFSGAYCDHDPYYFRWDEDSQTSWWTANHNVQEDPTELEIYIQLSKYTKFKAGSRVRSMVFASPSLKKITARPNCQPCLMGGETRFYSSSPKEYTSRAATGFTVGEILDLHNQVTVEHQTCYFNQVLYYAFVHLAEDDPVMLERRQRERKANERREERHQAREEDEIRQDQLNLAGQDGASSHVDEWLSEVDSQSYGSGVVGAHEGSLGGYEQELASDEKHEDAEREATPGRFSDDNPHGAELGEDDGI